jgi:glycosyltransferase involved in cell wall biosynthesis
MSEAKLRVLAVGITPPIFKASGGISAGVQLTERIATLCDATFLMMSDRDSDTVENGLRILRKKATNILAPFRSAVPREALTAMWRTDLKSVLKAQKPDVVHFHNPHPPGALAGAAADCRALGIPYVISTHGFVEFNDYSNAVGAPAWRKPIYRHLIREPVAHVAREAARILMLSPEETPILRSMGVADDRLDVVTNGVDGYFCEPVADAARRALVQRFNLPPGATIAFFVGNHTANKGIDVLLKAIPRTQQNVVAVIGGAIRSQAEHQKLLADTGVTPGDPRIRFTDFTSKEELRALYRSADMFVFPSYADTLPLVILEAMVSGLPVVSTRIGGIPFEVTPDTGMLVDAGDAAALAGCIDMLAADPDLRARLGAAGRERALALFDWEKSAQKAVAIYRSVLAGRSGQR